MQAPGSFVCHYEACFHKLDEYAHKSAHQLGPGHFEDSVHHDADVQYLEHRLRAQAFLAIESNNAGSIYWLVANYIIFIAALLGSQN